MNIIDQCCQALQQTDRGQILKTGHELELLRERRGRLFLVGNGGGAGHASHAASDFTKIACIPSFAWGDNVSQLTAYANDNSWESGVACWLDAYGCDKNDALFVFSVGGASDNVSSNLKWALSWAKTGPSILGIVGAAGGEVARYASACIVIPSFSTPVVEGVQAVLWHSIVEDLRDTP